MLKPVSLVSLFLALAVTGVALAQSDPTLHQVYEAARTGHLDQAQQMMNQVLRDHPRSAKAHYVAAEVDARLGNLPLARQELKTAEDLEPGLAFANQDSVRALQRELSGGRAYGYGAVAASHPARSSFPWGMVLLVVGGVVVLWMVLSRRSQTNVYPQYPASGVGSGGGPYGPYGGGPMGPGTVVGPGMGTGSGIMGNLATGLAVGAGVAAGEELVHHMLDGRSSEGGGFIPPASAEETRFDENPGMGGSDFGVSDGSSWDDGGSVGGDVGGGDDWT